MFLGEEAQPEILRDVRVLILIHQHVAKTPLILFEHVGIVLEDRQIVDQQVAEIGGVERRQPRLIGLVEIDPASVGEMPGFVLGNFVGRQAAVFPAIDDDGEPATGPAFDVEIGRLDHLLGEPRLIVGVENGEIGFEPHELRMAAQDLRADGVEGAEPFHALDRFPDELFDAFLHLARRLVGEGDGENLPGLRAACMEKMGEPRGQRSRLARARAGQHQDGAFGGQHGGPLLLIQPFKIGGVFAGAGRRPGLAGRYGAF